MRLNDWLTSAALQPGTIVRLQTPKALQLQGQYITNAGMQNALAPPAPTPGRGIPKAFMAGPILAWRMWRVTANGLLTSIFKETVWPADEPLVSAVPDLPNPTEPSAAGLGTLLGISDSGNVGIYALKRREDLNRQGYTVDGQKWLAMVVGRVALWGKVIEHQKGYRAQYAYPYELYLEPSMPGFPVSSGRRAMAAAIRQQYGCEVRE